MGISVEEGVSGWEGKKHFRCFAASSEDGRKNHKPKNVKGFWKSWKSGKESLRVLLAPHRDTQFRLLSSR